VTLYASVFTPLDVLLACNKKNKDIHWRWLKSHGAFDFIQDIVEYDEEPGIIISPLPPCSIRVDKLDEFALINVINRLRVYTLV
jgi:hypothetical protein